MILVSKRAGPFGLRLLAVLFLLGRPSIGSAAGMWSVIAPEGSAPGHVKNPGALAVNTAGTLYVADGEEPVPLGFIANDRLQERDAQAKWSVIATNGTGSGQVSYVSALAVDAPGNLYVADGYWSYPRIQKRDAHGNWFVIAPTDDSDPRQVNGVLALAADAAGNLYVADTDASGNGRIQKRDAQGNWSILTAAGAFGLAADTAGNLYVADADANGNSRIQRRDVQGNWSVIATHGSNLGQFEYADSLAVDGVGDLYATDYYRVQKRDAQGSWSIVADEGSALGQVEGLPDGLAVDTAGNLYVADAGNHRVQVYTPLPAP